MSILPDDPQWAGLFTAWAKAGYASVFAHEGTLYHAVGDGDGVRFVEIPNTPERTSFGTVDSKHHGWYPPTWEEEA